MFSSRQGVRLTALARNVLYSSQSRHSTCANDFPRMAHRSVPKTLVEYNCLRSTVPVQPSNPKLLRVAIIGQPNVGKSTLVNKLMNWKVCAVSSKVHTTRHNAKAILVNGETQIVFLDTPGVVDIFHGRKHHLEASMIVDPEHALLSADLVAVMVDASDHWRRHTLDEETLRLLKFNAQLTSILIVNKVDLLKSKRQILEFTHSLTGGVVGGVVASREKIVKKRLSPDELFARAEGTLKTETTNLQKDAMGGREVTEKSQGENKNSWRNFSRIFMISALNNDGVNDIRNFLLDTAKPSEWMYPFELVTDQNPHELGTLIVREKVLNHLPREVPYNLQVKVAGWDLDTAGVLHIVIEIVGKNTRHVKYILGEGGKAIKAVAAEARQDLAATFRSDVSLKLIVKTDK
ncbi:GTPase Era, mitochondrial [Dermacentor andersoni]|uniref:GTPase Era, mitochondrial n=1 Tax=Dermacentor andersoni TaxID=34620 RepID=UPI0021550F27|nr:GTPase Era, mitochondrial-like [Dermacentor andersoni]